MREQAAQLAGGDALAQREAAAQMKKMPVCLIEDLGTALCAVARWGLVT